MLKTQELGEADLIVSLLAEHRGKVRGVAPSARRSRRRFGGVLEPMTRVRAVWREKVGRDLDRIERLECIRSYAEMQADPVKQSACAILSEIAELFPREGEADTNAFRLLGAVLDALEGGQHPWIVVRYFELWTLQLHGLLPDLDACAGCSAPLSGYGPRWATAGAGLRCAGCGIDPDHESRRLRGSDREFILRVRKSAPQEVSVEPRRVGPGSALETLLRGTLECYAERRFRTYRHLRRMLQEESSR